MSRDVPFEEGLKCDICGELGAFDFMGDYYCHRCEKGCTKCHQVMFSANGDTCTDCNPVTKRKEVKDD